MSRYLSNGTMGEMWVAEWCAHCENDHVATHVAYELSDYENGCEILARLYLADPDENIPELVEHDREPGSRGWSPREVECRMFTPCQHCHPGGDDEPKRPPPVDPNQQMLFEVVDECDAVPMMVIPIDELATEPVSPGF